MVFTLGDDPYLESGIQYLIDQHVARFGKTFDYFAVLGDPKKEKKLESLLTKALDEGKPVTDKDLQLDDTPDDVYI